jgi:lathosterol oxidase
MSLWEDLKHNLAADFQITFGRYLAAVAVTVSIVWLLKRTPWKSRQIQSRTASWSDIGREFRASLEANFVYLIITVILMAGVKAGVFQRINQSFGLATDFAYLAAILLAHDAYFYWTHRLMHHPKLYKSFHLRHHKSVTPTPFAAYAFAAPEALLNALFIPLWQLFIATPGTVLGTFLLIQIIRNTTQHAGLELHPRWWIKNPITRWISTTTHHDIHHSGGFNHNFGFYFTFWDKIMGTEHPDYVATFDRVTARPAPKPQSELAPSPVL